MIVGRSLFRVDHLFKVTNPNPSCKPGKYADYCLRFILRMNDRRQMQSSIDYNEKRQNIAAMRGQICSQASASEAEVVNEATNSTVRSSALNDIGGDTVHEGESATGKHSISIEVGASVMRFIKGKGGSMQERIEEEMGVQIIFPSSRKEDYVTVEGFSIDSVTRASEKIQSVIKEAVKSRSLDYSHFVSLPLAIHPELVEKLVNFQNSILGITGSSCLDENPDSDSNEHTRDNEVDEQQIDKGSDDAVKLEVNDENERVKLSITKIPLISYQPKASTSSPLSGLGIERSIFIKPKTFHLTVLMLKLWNKDRVTAATDVLRSISSKVMDALDNRPVLVRLKGLECMKGSLAKARVLYAPVEEIGSEGRLLRACQVIIDAFVEAGLVLELDANHNLKLHATIMNARHRKRNIPTRMSDSFDARGILKQYGSEEWGDYLIREAHLSQRFAFDKNGYYHCCSSIRFPDNMQID